jgi:hypothetical protein
MAVEKKWLAVPATPFTADGTQFGVVTIADTNGFKVKGDAYIAASGLPLLQVQIQRVISSTTLIVGHPGTTPQPNHFINISAYTVVSGAVIGFPEQDKNKIKADDIDQAVYEADPTVAIRVIPVDPYGALVGPDNPLPVAFDGTITVGEVEIKGSPSGDLLNVNADGSINVNIVESPVTGQTVRSFYNQVVNIVEGVETTLVSYTVPPGYTAVLERASVSGENIARYDVLYNSALFDTRRTMFGGDLTSDFDYTTGTSNGLVLNAGDNIIIQVLHNRPYVGTFNARLQVLEIA